MQPRTKAVVAGAAAVVVAAGIGSAALAASQHSDPPAERQAEAAYTDAHRGDAAVSQADAERIALAARPGTVVESHLQSEGQGLRWEVKIDDGGRVSEVQLDPSTGAIVADHRAE